MSARYFQMDDPLPVRGLWAMSVPWHLVPELAACPNARHILASLYLDPPSKKAAIVLWPGVDPRWVLALFAKLEQRHRARHATRRSPRAA
jgi:hypothetical protein